VKASIKVLEGLQGLARLLEDEAAAAEEDEDMFSADLFLLLLLFLLFPDILFSLLGFCLDFALLVLKNRAIVGEKKPKILRVSMAHL